MHAESSIPASPRVCSKCRRSEPSCGFYRNRAHKNGWDNWCVECRRERDRRDADIISRRNHALYCANRDERLAKQKAYYQAHRDERRAYERQRSIDHAEEFSAYQKAYRLTHRDTVSEYQRAYRDKHRDKINARLREHNAARRAQRRAWWKSLTAGIRCEACGGTRRLHFHHVDPESKYDSVTNLMRAPMPTIVAEMKKCRVLCVNCHMKEHARLRALANVRRHA